MNKFGILKLFFLSFLSILSCVSFAGNSENSQNKTQTTEPNSQKVSAVKSGLETELEELIDLYTNGSIDEQKESVNKRIRFTGVTDTQLFDIAEKNLLNIYKRAKRGKDQQYASWLAQMLAFSGNEKYVPTLKLVESKAYAKKVQRHARSSLIVLPKYHRWNKAISRNLEDVAYEDLPRARLINTLNAEDPELVRGGASIADDYYLEDEEITDLAEKRLLELYKRAEAQGGRDEYAEASSWLCKILGKTGKQKYRETLITVNSNTYSPALTRWSSKALRMLKRK